MNFLKYLTLLLTLLALSNARSIPTGNNGNPAGEALEVDNGKASMVFRSSQGIGAEQEMGVPDDISSNPISKMENSIRNKREAGDDPMGFYVYLAGLQAIFFGSIVALEGLAATPVVTAAVVSGGVLAVAGIAAIAAYAILKNS